MNEIVGNRNSKSWHRVGTDSLDGKLLSKPLTSNGTGEKELGTNIVNRHSYFFRFSFLITDFVALNLITLGLLQFMPQLSRSSPYVLFLIVTNVSWIVSTYITALYFSKTRFFKHTAHAYMIYTTLTLLVIFIYNYDYSRVFVILSLCAFAFTLMITRSILIGSQHYLRNQVIAKRVIILGHNDLSRQLAATLSMRDHRIEVQGFFDDKKPNHQYSSDSMLGRISESLTYSIENNISEIYSTIPPESNSLIYEIAHQAEKNFIRFKFVPDFRIFINKRVHLSFESDIPIFSLRPEPLQEVQNQIKKRGFDIIFSSLVILFLLSWLIPIIAILIKLDSRGPVFFKQLRSGKNNRPFLCFKFRSLRVNDEAHQKQVTRDDTRLTRLGRILRKTNLDELPQFFNVFQGHMSVVGPRPHMLKHTEEFSGVINQYMIRNYVKPGVTGWAQINGHRGEIKREEQLFQRVKHDIYYMENWSMWFDLRIIFLTIYTTIRGDKNAF